MKLLLTALSTLPNVSGTVVWRGIGSDLSHIYTKDNSFVWWSFSSCSKSLTVVNRFLSDKEQQILFNIQFKMGTDISQLSTYPSEEEILLPPGAFFRVMSCERFSDKLFIVHLEEQFPPVLFLDGPLKRQ